MQEAAALVWTPASQGQIAIGSRPSLKALSALKALSPCNCVFSLLHAEEDLAILEQECMKLGLAWTNVQIRGANKQTLRSDIAREAIEMGLNEARKRLAAGESLFIHCAGGVHRTGFFTYTLLRLEGYSRLAALEAIKTMRLRTYQSCGQFRFELAEKWVQSIQFGTEMDISGQNSAFQDCIQTEFVRGEEIPLLWMDISLLSDQEIAISCHITNGQMTKVVEGPNIACQIPNFTHQMTSQWLQNHLKTDPFSLQSQSISDTEGQLMDFLESSLEPNTCKLANYYPYLDSELLEAFFPKISAFLHYRVVDLSTFALLSQEKVDFSEPPIAFLRRMRLSLFEPVPRGAEIAHSS